MPKPLVGVIGGSGLYAMESLEDAREHAIDTPYGAPSDIIVTGRVRGAEVAFLARHGRGHRLIPGEVPYRANIHALKTFGVRYLISVSAVGSLSEDIRPLDMVLPDQFIDLTRGRESTFFGDGVVAHVSMAEPVCRQLTQALEQAFFDAGLTGTIRLHRARTYVCIEGPAFSTRAESEGYRRLGAGVVGMTNMPEAKLAREAQMAYASLALVTDYDCWHPQEAEVTAELALANLAKNAANAQRLLVEAVGAITARRPRSLAHTALRSSLVTQRDAMSEAARARLDVLLEQFGVGADG